MNECLIGLDVGTSGTKAIAMTATGKLLATAVREYPLHSPKPNWAEQNPEDWRKAAIETLQELTSKISGYEVKAIGLTGQMHGSVFLDANNHVLRPALLWCDQRTARQCLEITERAGGAPRLIEMVSNPALTGFTAPKILWLRDHEPQIYDKVCKVLLPKDFIRLVLTGEFATDVADASGTLLFDVKNRSWHKELISLLQIPFDWLPPSYEGPEVTGQLSRSTAALTGLPAGVPVVAGGGDQAAGGVGCGIVKEGIVSESLGTSGVVFAFSEKPQVDPQGRVHTFCHSVPYAWHTMGVMLSAGGALQWFRNQLCAEERQQAMATKRDVYDIITQMADGIPPGAEGLIFLPYLSGERTPHKDPFSKGAFIGLSLRHTKAHMARSVLEGVALGMRDSLDIMREMGVPVQIARISGGGGKSVVWRKIMADTGDVPVATINVDEGPAYGAAILAAVGAKLFPTVEQACETIIHETDRITPESSKVHQYENYQKFYRRSYQALSQYFSDLAILLDQ